MAISGRLSLSLFLLRVSVFGVMLVWTLDKFLNPEHAARVAAKFYLLPEGLGAPVFMLLGALQLLVILAFLAGYKKRFSYLAVLIMHAVSTASSWMMYLDPFAVPNILFFAAFPMLAACTALYLLREEDTLVTLDR